MIDCGHPELPSGPRLGPAETGDSELAPNLIGDQSLVDSRSSLE